MDISKVMFALQGLFLPGKVEGKNNPRGIACTHLCEMMHFLGWGSFSEVFLCFSVRFCGSFSCHNRSGEHPREKLFGSTK